ncbi:hypothetical protein FD08_GL000331 [Lentilactobacillus parakefiri DSM 10551]|nr:hypothetical protein FD08_GL000331 [Lentilactobacillus parakefiri DSM 10551]
MVKNEVFLKALFVLIVVLALAVGADWIEMIDAVSKDAATTASVNLCVIAIVPLILFIGYILSLT